MPSTIDHWIWNEISFPKWRSAVNLRMKQVYLIGLADAGLDDNYLKPHWKDKQPPYEFVEWFANKRDLDPKSAFGL
jgi:hypothetical protein